MTDTELVIDGGYTAQQALVAAGCEAGNRAA